MESHFKTIVISDFHLGTKGSKAKEVVRFLKQFRCNNLILNGDVFDSVTSNFRWIAYLGDIGYTFLLWLNRQINHIRRKKGLAYFSLSQYIKSKVKSAVSYIDDYERELSKIAKAKGCDGIICGHIHKPELKTIDGISYFNSGDWVESLTALAEDFNGNWKLIYYCEMKFSYVNQNVVPINRIRMKKAKNTPKHSKCGFYLSFREKAEAI